MDLPYAEPYKIKTIEKIYRSTRQEREQWIREAQYKPFQTQKPQIFYRLAYRQWHRAIGATRHGRNDAW